MSNVQRAMTSVALILGLVLGGGLQPFQVLVHARAPQRQGRSSQAKPIAPATQCVARDACCPWPVSTEVAVEAAASQGPARRCVRDGDVRDARERGLATMTQDDIDTGRSICVTGVALVRPAECLIFRISRKTVESRAGLIPIAAEAGCSTREPGPDRVRSSAPAGCFIPSEAQ